MSYKDKLISPKWQKKRLEILSRDKFKCCYCEDIDTELQIHHKSYIYGKEPWEYEDDNFQTLCKNCHFLVSNYKEIVNTIYLVKKMRDIMLVYYVEDFTEVNCVGIFQINELGQTLAVASFTRDTVKNIIENFDLLPKS